MYIAGLIILSVLSLLFILLPYHLAKKDKVINTPDVDVYKAQLNELELDIERQLLSKSEASQGRLEIERRLLKAADTIKENGDLENPNKIVVLILILALLSSLVIYNGLGTIGMPDFPRKTMVAEAPETDEIKQNKELVKQIKQRLRQSPDEVKGWTSLAHLHMNLGNYNEAADALYIAQILEPDNYDILLMYAESLIQLSKEKVTPAALLVLHRAQNINPEHIGAKFFLALAEYQAGEIEVAYATWLTINANLNVEDPMKSFIGYWINLAEVDLGMREDLPQMRAPSITEEQAKTIQSMDEDQQQELIRQMVAQLADKMVQDPQNLEGWMRLSRAYMVLGQKEDAINALESAIDNADGNQKFLLQKELEKLTNLE